MIRTGQNWSGQVAKGYDRPGQVMTRQERSGNAEIGQDMSYFGIGQDVSGREQGKSGQGRTCKINSKQLR